MKTNKETNKIDKEMKYKILNEHYREDFSYTAIDYLM